MDRKQSQFTAVDLLGENDFIPAFGQSTNKKISKPDFFKQIKDETQVFIYPTIEQLQSASLIADPDFPIYVRVEETEYRLYKITSLAAGENDIALNNGATATRQEEYQDIGYVFGPSSSQENMLPLFAGTTGTELKQGPVVGGLALSMLEIDSVESTSFVRLNSSGTAQTRTISETKQDLSINNVNNTSDANKPVSTAQRAEFDKRIVSFDSVADMVASTSIKIGDKVEFLGYHAGWAATAQGPVGGNVCEIVAAGTGTADGGSFIDLVGISGQAKGLFLDGEVTPQRFGARGDGFTDDTSAIQAMHSSGRTSLHYPAASYLISGSITITSSRLSITGEGSGVSRIIPTVFTGSVFNFTSSQITRLLIDGLSVETVAGNKIDGATFSFDGTVTNAHFNDLYLRHYYDAFRFNAETNKCYFTCITLDQFGRTVETYANSSFNFVGKPVDVHMDFIQGSGFSSGSADPNKIRSHFKMGAVDGLYVSNSHFFYADQTVIFNPTGTDIVSSCAFDTVYFDSCRLNHVFFDGDTTGAYQDIKFTTCVFRDAIAGPSINVDVTGSSLDQLKFSNCTFRDNFGSAIFDTQPTGNLVNLVVSGCTFDGNNISNTAVGGDIVTRGDNANINGNTHVGGGAAGRAVYFLTGAENNIVSSANVENSTTGGFTNSGSGNEFHSIIGVKVKNKGFGTITTGNTSVTITHGLHFTPSESDIVAGFSSVTAVPTSANLYVNSITATQFDIVMTSAAAANVAVKWRAELW